MQISHEVNGIYAHLYAYVFSRPFYYYIIYVIKPGQIKNSFAHTEWYNYSATQGYLGQVQLWLPKKANEYELFLH